MSSEEGASVGEVVEAPDHRSDELAAKHRQAAKAVLPDLQRAIAQLRDNGSASVQFIRDQGRGYMGLVDLSRAEAGDPVDRWFISGHRRPMAFALEVLEHEVPAENPGLEPEWAGASLVVPFQNEPFMLAGAAASPSFLRAGAPGEVSAHVSIAEYGEGGRWVHYERSLGDHLYIELADQTLSNVVSAIDEHLKEIDAI